MRNTAWLKKALSAIDFIYFDGKLAEMGVTIQWFRPQPAKEHFLYAEVSLPSGPIRINTVLAYDWVPSNVVLSSIYHEALHVFLGAEHTPYFDLMEKQFPKHAEVSLWEAENQVQLMKAERPFVRSVR